jgi:anti-sigma B factor antagonist
MGLDLFLRGLSSRMRRMSQDTFQVIPKAQTAEGIQILEVKGALTSSTSAAFHEAVAQTTAPRLILDLTAVPSVDSVAVGALVRAFVSCNKAGRKLALVGLSHRVRNVLELTGIDPLFDAYATVSEAQQAAG